VESGILESWLKSDAFLVEAINVVACRRGQRVERRQDLAPWQTRRMICELINVLYTLPE